jgi:hypothetical protein
MLKFFRKIRQTSIAKGRVKNYLLYAIGEITLVVIGILIAVSFNNGNEINKRKNVEKELLSALNIEFKENLDELKTAQVRNDSAISSMSTVLKLMNQSKKNVFNPAQMDSIFLNAMSDVTWNPSGYTSQRVNLLSQDRNAQLLSLMYDWSRSLDRLKGSEIRSTSAIQEIIAYIKKFGSLRNLDATGGVLTEGKSTISSGNMHLLTDPVFENIVNDAIVYTRHKNAGYKRSIEKIEAILELTQP